MHFVNEYEMTRGRYVKWATPVFYRLKIFYILMAMCAVSIFIWIYFATHGAEQRWITLACFMVIITLYRGLLFRPLSADKQYRLMRQQRYNDKAWTIKMDITDHGIKIVTNGKKTGYAAWDRVTDFVEAKSFYDLVVEYGEQIRLDKACFTEGDAESFKVYMSDRHADIPYKRIERELDK